MIRARFLIREINGLRLPPKVQCRAKSVVSVYPIEHNKTKDVNNELQYARPTKDIPGPKALPLLGNWFRFIPYIGKSSLFHQNVFKCLRFLSLLDYSSSNLNMIFKSNQM